MKKFILTFLPCCFATIQTLAADEPLIPTPLNNVLLKIRPGMSTNQVESVLSTSYPKVSGRKGDWSGQTGYIEYKLDERFRLSISSITRHGKEVLKDGLSIYLFDWQSRRQADTRLYYWKRKGTPRS